MVEQSTAQSEELGARLWLVIVLILAVAFAFADLAGFSFSDALVNNRLVIPIMALVIGRAFMLHPSTRRIGGTIEGICQFSMIALIGVMTSDLAALGDRPLVDAQLLFVDRHLGYDWLSYARFCAAHPYFLETLKHAYKSAYAGPATVALLLNFADRRARFDTYALAMLISALLTSSIFSFWPATTAWTHLGLEKMASDVLPALPVSAHSWITSLLHIRGSDYSIMAGAAGLIAFPSYHCVMALTFAWALWPLRQVRIIAVVVAGLTIAAAPIFGSHYFTDLIGGAVTTAIGIVLAKKAHAALCNIRLTNPFSKGAPGMPTAGRRPERA